VNGIEGLGTDPGGQDGLRACRRGQVFSNPATGERMVLVTDPETSPDATLVVHGYVRPGGRVAAPHTHPGSTERFRVLAGSIGMLVGNQQSVLHAGQSAEVPPGTIHDWWQVGEEEAQLMVEVSPGDRFVHLVGTMFGLARDGKVNRRGLPHMLQAAVSMAAYGDSMVISSPPPVVQRVLFGGLAPLGRLLGRQPVYPQYLFSKEIVEPDPAALALLDAQGRLRIETPPSSTEGL
jgi:mannose-6-phosphate isomerase-like protein (cupin superfamily)